MRIVEHESVPAFDIGYHLRVSSYDPEVVAGTLRFDTPVQVVDSEVPEFVEVEKPVSGRAVRIRLLEGDDSRGEIVVEADDEEFAVSLPSAPTYTAVKRAIDGDASGALELIDQNYSGYRYGWGFREACKHTICYEAFVTVLDALAGVSDDFSHIQYRSCHGYFAKRIGDTSIQGVHSITDLVERIEKWNGAENLRDVTPETVLAERLGRRWYRDEHGGERETLRSIGADPVEFDHKMGTVFPATWMAHLIVTEGIEAASEYADKFPTPSGIAYDDLKRHASDASYDSCAEEWGRVVSFAASRRSGNVRFGMCQYLKCAAFESRDKTRIEPMLYAAALEAAPDEVGPDQLQRLEAQRAISTGHIWRRDSAVEYERRAFSRAVEVSKGGGRSEYTPDPEKFVEALSSLAHSLARDKEDEASRQCYRDAIQMIERCVEETDLGEQSVEDDIEFLRSQID